MRPLFSFLVSASLILALSECRGPAADGSSVMGSLALNSGSFAFLREDEPFLELGFEYRFPRQIYGLRPLVGATLIDSGGRYVFGGLLYEWDFAEDWYLAPSLAAGIYEEGGSLDLGGSLEFRSSAEVGYRINGWSSIGLKVYHLSNANLYAENGGSESLALVFTVDLARLLTRSRSDREAEAAR